MNKMSLNELEFILGQAGGTNIIGITGNDYEKASENDQEKLKQMIIFGLTGLHYLRCINAHNENIK